MQKNVGDVDRMARALTGLFFTALPFIFNYSNGDYLYPVAAASATFGVMLLLSAAFGYCYFYRWMGVSTC